MLTGFGDVTIAYDDHALAALLGGATGETARYLAGIGIRLESQMKINVTAGGPTGRGPSVRTGRLRASMTWQVSADGRGLYVDAGTNVDYGRYLEEGPTVCAPILGPGPRSKLWSREVCKPNGEGSMT